MRIGWTYFYNHNSTVHLSSLTHVCGALQWRQDHTVALLVTCLYRVFAGYFTMKADLTSRKMSMIPNPSEESLLPHHCDRQVSERDLFLLSLFGLGWNNPFIPCPMIHPFSSPKMLPYCTLEVVTHLLRQYIPKVL